MDGIAALDISMAISQKIREQPTKTQQYHF